MVNTASAGVNKSAAAAQGGHRALPLASLNHISVVCRSLESSLSFYRDVLGFIQIRRPGSFDFDGAWLFNFGIGVHLLQAEDRASLPPKKAEINPKDNHISFTTCESMEAVQRRLKELGIRYVQRRVEEGGIHVDQIFFHDPDGFMIEVCTCDNLPVIPLVTQLDAACAQPAVVAPSCKRVSISNQHQQLSSSVPAAVPDVPPTAAPTSQQSVGGGCVGEVVDPAASMSASVMTTCSEHACMQV
ncbi:hypothetical protein CFC21_040422 [Triticum aestivum]|uniref:Glyoxalase n=2 Tax=Triticum aestivum TaxID=4565 RepID=B4ERW1_WHEAT|nr:uncharacterized protein LOC123069103 [Triticum aestivum]KAF7028511.1 hypothetical protein CFC21_040422 [Triticum aestivum]CAP72290.1 Glyoxalase [Triticum aestivum]CDM81975.1 unnamed protein product [Triticum aestivum]